MSSLEGFEIVICFFLCNSTSLINVFDDHCCFCLWVVKSVLDILEKSTERYEGRIHEHGSNVEVNCAALFECWLLP